MANFFDIQSVFFTFAGYDMSYIEFFGTVFNVWCVWLAARNRILTWPVGLVGIVLYIFLFWQIRLYSDLVEQIYFFGMSFYGWWLWRKSGVRTNNNEPRGTVSAAGTKERIIYALVIAVLTLGMGYGMGHIHLLLPGLFPEAASYPYLDAFTTVMSFAATLLMARKKVDCWYLWILVDIIGIGLYYAKGVKFISAEYVLFLAIALKGLYEWRKDWKEYVVSLIDSKNEGACLGEIHAAACGAPAID